MIQSCNRHLINVTEKLESHYFKLDLIAILYCGGSSHLITFSPKNFNN